jgi:hypothetical protein
MVSTPSQSVIILGARLPPRGHRYTMPSRTGQQMLDAQQGNCSSLFNASVSGKECEGLGQRTVADNNFPRKQSSISRTMHRFNSARTIESSVTNHEFHFHLPGGGCAARPRTHPPISLNQDTCVCRSVSHRPVGLLGWSIRYKSRPVLTCCSFTLPFSQTFANNAPKVLNYALFAFGWPSPPFGNTVQCCIFPLKLSQSG